jgi:hypothetical protein
LGTGACSTRVGPTQVGFTRGEATAFDGFGEQWNGSSCELGLKEKQETMQSIERMCEAKRIDGTRSNLKINFCFDFCGL